jgi:hypothetical protein
LRFLGEVRRVIVQNQANPAPGGDSSYPSPSARRLPTAVTSLHPHRHMAIMQIQARQNGTRTQPLASVIAGHGGVIPWHRGQIRRRVDNRLQPRLLIHILRDQPLQQRRRNRCRLLRVGCLRLGGQAQPPSPILQEPRRSPLPPPPTGRPVVQCLPPADGTCPSPPPCPRSAWCPTPPESSDSSSSRPAAPLRSIPSAALPHLLDHQPGLKLLQRALLHRRFFHLQPSATFQRRSYLVCSMAATGLTFSWARRTGCGSQDWEAPRSARYRHSTERRSLPPGLGAAGFAPSTRIRCRARHKRDTSVGGKQLVFAESGSPADLRPTRFAGFIPRSQTKWTCRPPSASSTNSLNSMRTMYVEALWALDQPRHGLDWHAMLRDTLASREHSRPLVRNSENTSTAVPTPDSNPWKPPSGKTWILGKHTTWCPDETPKAVELSTLSSLSSPFESSPE